jgi:hypothetical protein
MDFRSTRTPKAHFALGALSLFLLMPAILLPHGWRASDQLSKQNREEKTILANGVVATITYHSEVEKSEAARATDTVGPAATPTPSLVISQVYGNAGTAGASYSGNYIEIFNRSASAVDFNQWTTHIEGDNFGASLKVFGSLPIQSGQYLLIQIGASGASGKAVPADISLSSAPTKIGSSGRVYLVNPNGSPSQPFCPLPSSDIADYVGFGSSSCFEGSGPGPALNNTLAVIRKFEGCVDTDDNSSDLGLGTPNPRNLSYPSLSCSANPNDTADFFVRQHYLDFLNRQADASGLSFWKGQITSCGADAQCVEVKRINVSAAYFLSIEFQQTGNLVYKMYKAGFGNPTGKPVAVDRAPFLADTRQIQSTPAQVIVGQGDWQAQLETNKQAFALAFVQRTAFQSLYAGKNAADYVSSLFGHTGASPTAADTAAAINAFNAAGGGDAGRAAALRSVAESNSVTTQLNNEAFVLMQYFGYLQRNPNDPPDADYSGYNFWLNKLNQFNGDFIAAEMVKAFIAATEYRQRFGP